MARTRKIDDPREDLIELVAHPGWRVVRKYAQEAETALVGKLKESPTNEFELYKKVGYADAITSIQGLINRVEQDARRYLAGFSDNRG